MKQTSYVDEEGRYHAVMLPDGIGEEDASQGLPLGPPSLEDLGLPEELEIRLHNQLFSRRIFTAKDVRKRRVDVFGALQATFKVDTERIVQVYLTQEVQSNERRPGFKPLPEPPVAVETKQRTRRR